eukprot:scaffold59920_cov61-Attheya_sp.AAC.3
MSGVQDFEITELTVFLGRGHGRTIIEGCPSKPPGFRIFVMSFPLEPIQPAFHSTVIAHMISNIPL